jgi:hypothetical protein
MMIWALTLRRQFLLMAVIDWSCTGIWVPSMIHGWLLGSAVGRSARQYRHQVMDGAVHRGLAGVKQCGQRAGGQVGAQMDQHQQHPYGQR